MSNTADDVLRELEQRAINDGVSLDELDPWIAGALGVPVACLYAYLRVAFAAERWQLNSASPGREDAVPLTLTRTR